MNTWVKLDELRDGAIFEDKDGTRAVKSEYHYSNGQPQCILLLSGEYAHWPTKGDTLVRELEPLVEFPCCASRGALKFTPIAGDNGVAFRMEIECRQHKGGE